MNMHADVLFVNAHILSMDKRVPFATALAVRNGRILAMGRDDDLANLKGPHTQVIDVRGRSLLPGFTDSHIHLVAWALQRQRVDLWGVRSLTEALARVQAHAKKTPGKEWVRGGGWDASLWPDLDGQWPTAAHLDAVVPDRPVVLDSKDLHSLWVNSRALRLAGITAQTPDPPGGVIVRDPRTGEPTGILKETARDLVFRLMPPETEETWVRALREGLPALWAEGITAVHVLNDTPTMRNFRVLQRLRETGDLKLRALLYLPAARLDDAIRLGLRSGFGDDRLRIGGVKFFADGTLGSRTAAMLAPFLDDEENTGVWVTDPEELYESVRRASEAGLAVAVHAIGDRANREVMNIFQHIGEEHPERPRPALPHRIEHVQLLHPDDVARVAQLGLVASMQPIHATQDMELARASWGETRSRFAYAWRSVQRAGARLVFGSDAPVEQPSVLAGLHAALTRRRDDGTPGEDGWIPQERMCLRPALHAYTLAPAIVEGSAAWRGSLHPGKVADLIVLSDNLVSVTWEDPMRILDMHVVMTMFNGEIVYTSEE